MKNNFTLSNIRLLQTFRNPHGFLLGINVGHGLSLENIKYFKDNIPNLLEVSIGHALICEALYDGLEKVIGGYLKKLA